MHRVYLDMFCDYNVLPRIVFEYIDEIMNCDDLAICDGDQVPEGSQLASGWYVDSCTHSNNQELGRRRWVITV